MDRDTDIGMVVIIGITTILFACFIWWYSHTSTVYGIVENKWWTSSETCTDHKDLNNNFLYETCTTDYYYFFRTADGDFSTSQAEWSGLIVGHAIKFTQHGFRPMTPIATDIVDNPPTYLTTSD